MKKHIMVAGYVLLLTVASGYVVAKGAGDEPYHVFRHSDLFVQVGVSIALIALWLQFGGWLLYVTLTGRVARGWLALLVWVAIALSFLWQSPIGYAEDITKFVVQGH